MAFRDYNVNIAKQVNRLLPYYLRGRKMMLFLHGICSPLSFFNDEDSGFNKWAHRELIELSMTPQRMRLVWYLNNIVVPENEITLKVNQKIAINEETTSATILYFKSEIKDQSTAPLFYPHSIPTVTRKKTTASDKAKANIVTRKSGELGSSAGRFTISVPYSGTNKEEVSRIIFRAIQKFIPVGIAFRIQFT